MLKKFCYSIFLTALVCGMTACGSSEDPDAIEDPITDDVVEDVVEDIEDDVQYTLPSPLRVANMFKRSGLTYKSGLTNTPDNISKYNTKSTQKLNFGAYSADLAYCSLNDQNQDAITYMKTLGELSSKLWMTNIFSNVEVLERFEKNIGNEDSIAFVIADLQMELDDYLEENGMSHNGIIIFAGAWIETMYLGSNVLGEEDPEKLSQLLSEQVSVVDNLLGLCDQNQEDIDPELTADLKKLSAHLDKFRAAEESAEDSDEDVVVVLSKEEIKSLAQDVEEIRTKMVNG